MTEKERGIRAGDREGYIGGQGGPSPQPVDAAAKALAMSFPIQLHGRERGQQRRFGEEEEEGCWEDIKTKGRGG